MLNNNNNSIEKVSGSEKSLYVTYRLMFSDNFADLDFCNGVTDLNDFDQFLEATVPTYCIGQLTMPELELLQCLVYGICLEYAHKRGRKSLANLAAKLELAYQDICKLSLWIRGLFSDHVSCLFNVASSGEVTLIYKKPIQAGRSLYKFSGISITPSKFNFKAFSEFCSITLAPISNMDVHTARAIHQLISENVSFVCNLGEARNQNPFRFQVKQGGH